MTVRKKKRIMDLGAYFQRCFARDVRKRALMMNKVEEDRERNKCREPIVGKKEKKKRKKKPFAIVWIDKMQHVFSQVYFRSCKLLYIHIHIQIHIAN